MVFRPFIAPRFDLAAKPREDGVIAQIEQGRNPDLRPLAEVDRIDLPRGHVPALDAIRGLAIVAVTLYRFGGGGEAAASAIGHTWLVDLGGRGVDLFFVLSGFLITGILFDAKGKEHYFRNFYMRRSLRIFPLYYVALAVTLWILPLVSRGMAEALEPAIEQQAWLWLYGANVLQALRGEWCLGPLNHFWSLAIEEHFYLVWPAVIYFSSRQTAIRICGFVGGASVAARVIWLMAGGNDVTADVFTLLRMDGLALGGWLALAARSPGGLGWLKRYARAAMVLLGAAAVLTTVFEKRFFGLPVAAWAGTCGALLVLVVAAKRESWLERFGSSRTLQFFGKYSYGMYVFQLPLVYLVAPVMTAGGVAGLLGNAVAGQVVYCTVMFGATLVAALLSWNLFEKRVLGWKRYFE